MVGLLRKPLELTMIASRLRTIGSVVAMLLAASGGGGAQTMPPASGGAPGMAAPQPMPSQNPVCGRLEAQLVEFDRNGGDPARAEQLRHYEEAVASQQSELDRTVAQARRTGCEGSGFFLFARSQPPQCDDLNNRIQRMRTNLDRLTGSVQQLQSGRGALEGQRRQILMALGQNDCGPQYRAFAAPPAPARPRGFFETLFGGGGGGASAPFGSGDLTPSDQSSTYRTICVRTCDGFYFPVSYSTAAGRFREDEQTCQRMCPASEVVLFTYRNPGEDVSQAVSIGGQPYTSLPNAFRYRQEFNPACACRRPGESWAEALKNVDDTTVERGDIIVTDENAKALSQPRSEPRATKQSARAAKSDPKGSTGGIVDSAALPAPVTSAPLPDATDPAAASGTLPSQAATASQAGTAAQSDAGKRSIRSVGPPFIGR